MRQNLFKSLALGAVSVFALAACSQQSDQSGSSTAGAATPRTTEQAVDYQPKGWLAKSLPEIAAALKSGDVSAEELVAAYIARIKAVDQNGPMLHSVLAVNPDALKLAREADAKRAAGEDLLPLHGVPVLLKDNIESADNMPTTAGALALKDNVTARDSPLVAGLRAQGAIILGKLNLSQWANFRSNDSMSGWTALGGQVRNPHSLDRNPCGSSSGSGAAAAASLAAGTVGTETNGSIICPSNANGIVGFKPTVGLVPQQHIVPISASQDTAGPMTKTVKGAAMMMNAMAFGPEKTDYVAALDAEALNGARVGVLRYSEGSNNDIKARFNAAIAEMQAAGATVVEIEDNPLSAVEGFGGSQYSLLLYEFKDGINAYLASTSPDQVGPRNLDELIAYNIENAEIELALFDQSIFDAAAEKGPLTDQAYIEARDKIQKATREDGIDMLMAKHNLDILVTPSGAVPGRQDPINGDVWPPFPGAGGMAAIAGYPIITVPMGTIHNMSVGVSFIGAKNEDAKVMSFGYAYEQRTNLRAEPTYMKSAEDMPDVRRAMLGRSE